MIHGDLTSPALGRKASRTIALLPLGALEQHGNHLPVVTDTALVTEIARRAEATLPDKVSLLPTLWAGSSHHHLGFPGTVSISSETYINVLQDLVDCLIAIGYQRIVLLNGHGGNITPASEALYRLALKHQGPRPPWITLASYWQIAAGELAAQTFMESPRLTHACEYETSMMLALRTDWVDLRQAKGRRAARRSRYYDPLGYQPSRVSVCETFDQMTDTGAMGSPEKATALKGRQLFDLVSDVVVDFLREFSTWKLQRSAS